MKWGKKLSALIILLLCCTTSGLIGWNAAGASPREEVSVEQFEEDTVLVGGMPVGIYMETNGVLVLGTEQIEGMDGKTYEPAHNVVKSGDYIVAVNQQPVEDKKSLVNFVGELTDKDVVLTLRRDSETMDVKINAVEYEPKEYKLGIWVRDNVQGLGTITFLTQNNVFGALGHGIHDTDTNVLMDISDGNLYRTSIRSIIKGEDGSPGSMEGLIIYNSYNLLGTIEKNTESGIYGTVENIDALFEEQIAVQVASRNEIQTGPATIRCCIDGTVNEYAVEILNMNLSSGEINKGIVLQVTDSELLEKTGGIVQGMSGSPILQNGKLIGAVTHVFVNDPTKGYGIFAETMLQETEK